MGKNCIPFKMFKLRSMYDGADSTGVSSTSSNDKRITPIGKIIRKYKLDEVSQLLNVLIGDMSLVGPRPQVVDEVVNSYTDKEKLLLKIKPGITDISSIVFSDEGDILKNSSDPDKDYNKLIRPWKSQLGLLYVNNNNIIIDLKLIFLTIITIFSRPLALIGINKLLQKLGADDELIQAASRKVPLTPSSLDNL